MFIMASVIPQASHPAKVVSSVLLFSLVKITYHRVHELNTIVLGGVVTRGDHATDGLTVELA